MTVAEQRREEGRREGRREGREEGRREGRAEAREEILGALFRHRFGELTPRQIERMRSADAATQERWMVDVFTAASLDDLLT